MTDEEVLHEITKLEIETKLERAKLMKDLELIEANLRQLALAKRQIILEMRYEESR